MNLAPAPRPAPLPRRPGCESVASSRRPAQLVSAPGDSGGGSDELREARGCGGGPVSGHATGADSEVKVDGARRAGRVATAPRLSTARRGGVCSARARSVQAESLTAADHGWPRRPLSWPGDIIIRRAMWELKPSTRHVRWAPPGHAGHGPRLQRDSNPYPYPWTLGLHTKFDSLRVR